MPAKQPFRPSFYWHARTLPDNEATRLLRELAAQIYRERGGEAVEIHVAAHEKVRDRWLLEFDATPKEDAKLKPIPLREGLRVMGAIERGLARVEELREESWLQARETVFDRLGVRIPLPRGVDAPAAPEARRVPDFDIDEVLMGMPAIEDQPAPVAEPALSGKAIKGGLRKLVSAGVGMKVVQELKAQAKSGALTLEQFQSRVRELLTAA